MKCKAINSAPYRHEHGGIYWLEKPCPKDAIDGHDFCEFHEWVENKNEVPVFLRWLRDGAPGLSQNFKP